MGCSPSTTVVVNFDRTNVLYYGGEVVSGNIQLYVPNEKLEADEIDLKLIGEMGYAARQTTVINGQVSTRTVHHNIPFLSTNQVLMRPEPGQKELTIKQGQYSWPFQIQLPDYVPPSIGQPTAYPYVRYYVEVLIDKAWYKPNTEEKRYIRVCPRVNLLQQPNCMPTVFGNQNRKDMVLKGNLNKLGFAPGEAIHVTMEVDNPRQALIKQIDVKMIKSIQIGGYSNTYTVMNRSIPEMMRRSEEKIVQTFDIMIPSGPMTPSYQFQGGLQEVATVNVNYILKFDVNVDGIFDDFHILVPFIIGTEPNPNSSQS